MRKELIFLTVIFTISSLCACGNAASTTPITSTTTFPTASPVPSPIPTAEPVDEYAGVDKFIELFNATSDTDLSEPQEIDIHDDAHYRTEFRLGAYDNAVAKEASAGQATLEMINYGAWAPSGFRVYVTANDYESFQQVLKSCAAVFDSSITEAMIQEEVYDTIEAGNVMSTAFSFYLNDVTGTYEKDGDIYSFMMDQSPAEFLG